MNEITFSYQIEDIIVDFLFFISLSEFYIMRPVIKNNIERIDQTP